MALRPFQTLIFHSYRKCSSAFECHGRSIKKLKALTQICLLLCHHFPINITNFSNNNSMAVEKGAKRRVAVLQLLVALHFVSSTKVRHLTHFGLRKLLYLTYPHFHASRWHALHRGGLPKSATQQRIVQKG